MVFWHYIKTLKRRKTMKKRVLAMVLALTIAMSSIFSFDVSHAENLYIQNSNTNTSVTFSYFKNYIMGYIPKEEIITKFMVNGQEELEKTETITYGLGENYRRSLGFEVLQSYAIINEKITIKAMTETECCWNWSVSCIGMVRQ